MKKNRILHICNYAAPYKGNFINSLRALEDNEKIENTYLFPSFAHFSGAELWINELNKEKKCAYVQEQKFNDALLQLRKIIKEHKIDSVIMHFSNIRADLLVKLSFDEKKVIRFFHNTYRPRRKSVHILRSALWHNNILVGVSEFVSNELKKIYKRQKIVTIVNAIDFKRLDDYEVLNRDSEIVITMMGWDQKGKGVDLVLEAANNLRNKYAIKLNIIAAINSKPLEELIESLVGGENNWITILPPRHDVATYYNVSDVFVSASRAEAFGYSVVEAAYCGNSIVASRVDGQAELIIDGAYWFESENIDDLCQKMESAIVDLSKEEKQKQKEKVKYNIVEEYSLIKWSKSVADLINNTIG